MEKTGSINPSVTTLILTNWENRQNLEASKAFEVYLIGLEKTLKELKDTGKSNDIDRIIGVESSFIGLEHKTHQNQDPTVLPSLNAALSDFTVIHRDLEVVRSPETYKVAASTYHTKRQTHGVVADGFHEAINGHITRLGNRMSAVGISVPEKNLFRQRQANMRTAKKLYMDLQRKALGIDAPSKEMGIER